MAVFGRWFGCALVLILTGCGDSDLPAFARPPPVDDASVPTTRDGGADDAD